jgi:tRNA pseudouridine38-40 synthase
VRRWRLLLEYDGGPFVGWQRQASGLSVQALLEEAVARLTGETVTVVGGGRTDAGVHALGQVAHLDLEKDLLPERLMGGLNAHLRPHPVAVLEVRAAAPEFHARFAAIRKSYIYRILDRRAPPTLERGRVWHVPRRLDVERMHEAAQALVGRHDFTSFRASECQANSPLKTLDLLHVRRAGPFVEVRAVARSFLHHQVRNMVGTLVQVGLGKRPLGWPKEVLEARDRCAAGPTAPACGLYLERIDYPPA